jgi:hypothetical protein
MWSHFLIFLTWKQWALLHYIVSKGMPALQITNLRFKQARKSLKFAANCGTQVRNWQLNEWPTC